LPGINGKMSEINAAFGLLQLKYVDIAIARRKEIEAYYRRALAKVPGLSVLPESQEVEGNSSYFPIFVGPEYPLSRDALYQKMKKAGIHGRRYFFPLITDMAMYRGLPNAKNKPSSTYAAESVICLPIYPDLKPEEAESVINLIRGVQ
jgi:dTDP-4-amino-4,6-dideoxygalactose transaminase